MFKLQYDKFISLTYLLFRNINGFNKYDIFINLMLIIAIINVFIKSKIIIMLIKKINRKNVFGLYIFISYLLLLFQIYSISGKCV